MVEDTLERDGQKLLKQAGKNGRFQQISCIFIIGMSCVMCYNCTSLPLQKIRPKAECRLKEDLFQNFEPCTDEAYCDARYEKKVLREESIINWTVDFEVDCEQEKNFDFIISSIFLGGFISYFLMSIWADKYGRKKVLEWEVYGLLLVIVVSLFSNNLYMLSCLWFLWEFFNHGSTLLMIYASETMSQEYFSYICTLSNICFPLTGLITSILFFSIRNWRTVHLIFTVLAVVCALIFKYMIVESPQFCLLKRDAHLFLEIVKRIASVNQTEYIIKYELKDFENKHLLRRNSNSINIFEIRKNSDQLIFERENKKASVFEVFLADKNFRKEFLIVVYVYAVCKLVFYGILLNIEKFDENVFVFSTILYSSEITAEFISGVLAQKYGRIIVLKLSFYVAGISFFLFQFLNGQFFLRIFFCFWGNFGISSCFNVLIIYISEVFDVKIRSTASSYSKIPAQFLTIFSPFILSRLSFPFIFFAILCITSGYFIGFSRETLTKECTQEDTLLEEIESN